MNAKVESVGKKVLGALLLTGGFLGAFTLLARAQRADALYDGTSSSTTTAPVVATSAPVGPAQTLPARTLGDVGEARLVQHGIVDVADLTAAIVAEGDAPGPDSALGRPPSSTRLFSGKLDAEGTRMFVYETRASVKDANAWADERAKKLGLDAITLPAEGSVRADDDTAPKAQVPTAVAEGAKKLALGVDEESADGKPAKRKLYGGREGRVVLGVKDNGDKRVVTVVAIGSEKLEAPKAPHAADER